MRRPRIKRTAESIETPEGDLLYSRPSTGADIRVRKPTEEERRLLAALDGERTREDLEAEFGSAAVARALARLQELELLEDGADDDLLEATELARFDRQLRYFSDVGRRGGPTPSECQKRLRAARVAVLGVGGLGGSAALWLAAIGVGELLLVDGDRVELSNLNRQVLYTEADLGERKVEVARRRLRALDSAIGVLAEARQLGGEADVAELIGGADIVLGAADRPAHEIERWCNDACFAAGIPYITMSHFPPLARVGPLYVPGRTGCFACQESAYRRRYPLFDLAMEQLRSRPKPAAALGPACGLIGGQVGMEVMHLLTGLTEPATLGAALTYDLRTMEMEREPVVPEPGCPICGPAFAAAGGR